jgi:hypothetical protein
MKRSQGANHYNGARLPVPVWLTIVLVTGGSFGTAYLLTRYFIRRADLKVSHKGLLLAGVSFAGFFVLHALLKAFGIDLFRGTANEVFQAVLIAALLAIPARMVFMRLQSGPELVDLGPSPLRTMFLALGVFILLFATAGLITRSLHFGQAAVSMAQGILLLTLGFAHSQIRSHGISYAGGLLPWNRIARFEWTKNVLTIDLRRPRWWQDRVQLPIPPLLVGQVDELMRQHVTTEA